MFLFISNQNFDNRLRYSYGKSLFRLKVCLHYAYSLKLFLVYAYEKDLIMLGMCCCCDTDYNIIGHLASSERHLFCCIFDESEGKCFVILNRKYIVSMEKFMLPGNMLNIIVFCKAQHNA